MTETYRVLSQTALSATTLTDCYTVGASTSAAVSSVVICNRAATDTTFRVAIAVAGAVDNVKQYLYYDTPVSANNSFVATIGITLATTDVVRVYTAGSSVSVSTLGVEVQ